jgi:voltage-gated potassium channel
VIVHTSTGPSIATARAELARRIEHWFDLPLAVLGGIWLLLLATDLAFGATPVVEMGTTVIWGVFVLEFALRLLVAPKRGRFLRRNWLTALSLALPALRVLRFARVFRLLRLGRGVRALRVARLLTSDDEGIGVLASLSRGANGVLAALDLCVCGIWLHHRDARQLLRGQ